VLLLQHHMVANDGWQLQFSAKSPGQGQSERNESNKSIHDGVKTRRTRDNRGVGETTGVIPHDDKPSISRDLQRPQEN